MIIINKYSNALYRLMNLEEEGRIAASYPGDDIAIG